MTDVTEIDGSDGDASALHVGVAVSGWNSSITEPLLDAAVKALDELGVGRVTVVRVSGALELPLGARGLAEAGCDAVVALGAVVQGDTDHYRVVVDESARGLTLVVDRFGIPVANGILAVHDIAHAVDRSGPGPANKGHEAATATVAMALVAADLRQRAVST